MLAFLMMSSLYGRVLSYVTNHEVGRKSMTLASTSDVTPSSLRNNSLRTLKETMRLLTVSTVFIGMGSSSAQAGTAGLYEDKNGWSIVIPDPSWTSMPRTVPTPTMLEYTIEEVMFVGSSFAEGASLSVSRTRAPKLLKDMKMDWWFSPLSGMKDVGSPELIAKLLILQRQGEFEKKETVSEITKAEITGDELLFEFTTPLASKVNRKTIAKSYFKENVLYTAWVSALTSIFEADGGYGDTLIGMRDSFQLV